MAQADQDPHLFRGILTGVVLGAAVLILLTMLSAITGATTESSSFNLIISLVTAVLGFAIGFASSKHADADRDSYENVSISEMMGIHASENEDYYVHDEYVYVGAIAEDEYPVDIYDYEEDNGNWAEESIASYQVVSAPETSKMPVMTMDELTEASKVIEGHVLRTITSLPPLPSSPPTIHEVKIFVEPEPLIEEKVKDEKNLRDTLESGDLSTVINNLSNEEYIDALQYCLATGGAGSQEVVLRAKGRVFGFGARGTKKEDGSTDFTRADVLKMLRKARSRTSANVSD